MENYKFQIGQIVYIWNNANIEYLQLLVHDNNDYQCCIIRDRMAEGNENFYQLSNLNSFKNEEQFMTLDEFELNSGYLKVFNEEIFEIGFRNFPRIDNWLQENRIMEEEPDIAEVVCSYNGCELIDTFLEKSQKEIEKEEIDAIVLGEISFKEN